MAIIRIPPPALTGSGSTGYLLSLANPGAPSDDRDQFRVKRFSGQSIWIMSLECGTSVGETACAYAANDFNAAAFLFEQGPECGCECRPVLRTAFAALQGFVLPR